MPELPEVETVRDGLARWAVGRTITAVQVRHPRAVRRHTGGAADLAGRLAGQRIESAQRRGKFLWLPIRGRDGSGGDALVIHLGMSGQVLVQSPQAPDEKHLHVRFTLEPADRELRFVDQRTFGGVMVDELVDSAGGGSVPSSVAHIARDPMDPLFDDAGFVRRLRSRNSAVKRCLLDQTLVSGIGNIYADEALWRAGLHGERPGSRLTRAQADGLLQQVREVLGAAIRAGGTSFDALYVNVNGQSGYFDRSLNAYGQDGRPCARCGTPIRRVAFMNRSSYFCPSCQRPPRPRGRSAARVGVRPVGVGTPRRA